LVISPTVRKLSSEEAVKEKNKLDKEEYFSLVDMFSELMNAYGSFAESLGKVQKNHKEAYKEMFSLETMEKLPEMLNIAMDEKTPPELGRLVVTIFAKMTAFLPRITNMMELTADGKIKLGENLKSLAKDFKKLREWIEKQEKK
jgi:hypothetical protein